MGHIGAGGVDSHFRNQSGGRNSRRQKCFTAQDPDISPMMNRSDSFSSFTGNHANYSSSKANVANRSGGDNIVCKREAFYVVEVRQLKHLRYTVDSFVVFGLTYKHVMIAISSPHYMQVKQLQLYSMPSVLSVIRMRRHAC